MSRVFRFTFIVCVLALFIAACAAPSTSTAPGVPPKPPVPAGTPTTAVEAPQVGGTVTFAAITDPDTLDLHQTSNSVSSTIFGWIYEPLVYQDLDGSYKGLLAENWTVTPDNKTLTFKLRQGVKFSDGSSFNAEAVKFTFERLKRLGAKSPIFETFKNIETMETPDAYTFTLTMKEPYAPIFHDLQVEYAGILSPAAVKAANDEIGRNAVGTGPYKLKEWKTGQQIVLERNADHKEFEVFFSNKNGPYIQELRYKVIPEPATQLAALDAGEIDDLPVRAQDLPKYANDSRFKLYDILSYGVTYFGFDTARPPLDNPKLRQALAYAINKEEIVQVVFENKLARVACCPIAESIQGYDVNLKQYELRYDPAKAKAMLDDLGYKPGPDGLRRTPDGRPFQPVLYTTTSDTHGKIATLLQAQMKVAGVDMQIKQLESGALLAATPKAEHDFYLNGYSWNEPDMFSLFLSCDRVKSSNRVLYCNPDLEKLIKAGRTELDQTKRMQIYFDAQKLTMQEAPWQPLYMSVSKVAVSARIQGLKRARAGGLLWQDAYVTK